MPSPLETQIESIAQRARAAARRLAMLTPDARRAALLAMAEGLKSNAAAIQRANDEDTAAARSASISPAFLDRLTLNQGRIDAMVRAVREIADQPDTLGATLETITRPNGLVINKIRVPIGVVAIIYESRPNVTADAAAICFKAGSACILRGGSEAARTNAAVLESMLSDSDSSRHASEGEGRVRGSSSAQPPTDAIQLIPTTDRAAVQALLQFDQHIDLVIPRGGESLIRAVAENSRIPVLKHYKGVCHVYVDAHADLDMALAIAVNAKCQRPGVCNAMETLLVHESVAPAFLPRFFEATRPFNLELRADEAARRLLPRDPAVVAATDEDWSTEHLAQIANVRVVPDVGGAIDQIEAYGSRHSDAIVTADPAAADRFRREVDSATVYVNASTRFTDGAEFGKGAEIGVSTDKLHARGPCGVEELTTYKYVVEGVGQVRG